LQTTIKGQFTTLQLTHPCTAMHNLKLIPIDIDETKNVKFQDNPECLPILAVYPAFYKKIGYTKPWIGYFFSNENNEIVGMGGYKGKPKNGSIEIAYGTFTEFEGKGIGTEICRLLVLLSKQTDSTLQITARTFIKDNSSARILTKNGFVSIGTVYDEEDGDVWEWEFKGPHAK
jgi:ribosomal-protein-alanine N-acetyltransferase